MPSPRPSRDQQADVGRLDAIADAMRGGRMDQAAALSGAALADGLEHPLPLQVLAMGCEQDGRFEEAIELHRRRARLTPRDPGALSALAAGLFAARHLEAALTAYDAALAVAPNHPSVICGKARVLARLSRVDEAAALFRTALAGDAECFEALFGLALLAIEDDDWIRARDLSAKLHARYAPLPSLAWLQARIALGQDELEAARQGLAWLTADASLGPEQRADALLLLGEALDGLQRPAEAFATVVKAKAIQRRLFAERAAGREGAIARFERLSAWFGAADSTPWRTAPKVPPAPGEAASHVFLLGFPRSGATLLQQALAGHPDIVALEEAPTLAEAHAAFLSGPDGLQRLATLSSADAETWRARYWTEVRAHGLDVTGRLFVDKAPAGTVDLPLIAKLFPRAKVLFSLRDPRDVVLSCLRHNFQINAMTYAFTVPEDAAGCYGACMALAEVYRARLPLDLLEVRHESLVEDFSVALGRITAFLGLEPDAAVADVAAAAPGRRQVRTPSASQVRAGLNRKGLGRWRAYAAELAPVMPMLAPWMRRFGYPTD